MARRKVNKSSLVREALGTGLSKPLDVAEHIKKTHGVNVSVALIHNVKSTSKKGTRAVVVTSKVAPQRQATSNGTLTVEDVVAVKGLIGRLGVADLQQLISALA